MLFWLIVPLKAKQVLVAADGQGRGVVLAASIDAAAGPDKRTDALGGGLNINGATVGDRQSGGAGDITGALEV